MIIISKRENTKQKSKKKPSKQTLYAKLEKNMLYNITYRKNIPPIFAKSKTKKQNPKAKSSNLSKKISHNSCKNFYF